MCNDTQAQYSIIKRPANDNLLHPEFAKRFLMDCVKSSDKIPRGSNVVAAALVLFLFGCLFCFKEGHVYLQNLLRILRRSGDIN